MGTSPFFLYVIMEKPIIASFLLKKSNKYDNAKFKIVSLRQTTTLI